MQNLLVCQKKVKQYKIDRAADDVNVIHCHVMNGRLNYLNTVSKKRIKATNDLSVHFAVFLVVIFEHCYTYWKVETSRPIDLVFASG